MSRQFKRDYRLNLLADNEVLTIQGVRVNFEITRSLIGSPNTAQFTFSNLNDDTQYRFKQEDALIQFNAGYEGDLGLIFSGQVFNVFQERIPPKNETTVYAGDGADKLRVAKFNKTLSENLTIREMVTQISKSLGIGDPEIFGNQLDVKRIGDQTFAEPVSDILNDMAEDYGFDWLIDNETLVIIGSDDTRTSEESILFSAETGLLSTPTVTEIGVDIVARLNHRLLPGQIFEVNTNSTTTTLGNLNFRKIRRDVNGFYKAMEVKFSGDNRGDSWVTKIKGFRL